MTLLVKDQRTTGAGEDDDSVSFEEATVDDDSLGWGLTPSGAVPEEIPDMTDTKKPAKSTKVFSDDEMSAMKEAAKERKAAARRGQDEAAGEADALAKIAEMPAPDRAMAERIHAIVKASAPGLAAKTWYGMPAYAKDGKLVCFFKAADKFKSRYATFGFEEARSSTMARCGRRRTR